MTKSDTPGLTLYSRRGCHLCEDMISVLQDLTDVSSNHPAGEKPGADSTECRWQDHRYTLQVVDIDQDVELSKRFNVLVPALYMGEQEICHHFLDLVSLTRALDDFRKSGSTNG